MRTGWVDYWTADPDPLGAMALRGNAIVMGHDDHRIPVGVQFTERPPTTSSLAASNEARRQVAGRMV